MQCSNKINLKIQEILKDLQVPYIYIKAFKGYDKIYEYGQATSGNVNGNEKLFIYSCTKPMTSVCALRLIEENKISLDDYASKYLPYIHRAYIINEDGHKQIVGDKITIRHLLTMTAGFSYNLRSESISNLLNTESNPTTEQLVESFIDTPLLSIPGEKFNYSLCLDILAVVIEKVSNQKFSDYMNKIIFKPLNMQNTGFKIQLMDNFQPLYCFSNNIIHVCELKNVMVLSENYDSGGAGVISTANDYANFAKTLANGGKSDEGYQMLKPETVKLMHTGQVAKLNLKNEFGCIQGDGYDYGMGVRVRCKPTSWGLPCGEFGWDGAAGMYLMVDPVNNVSVVIGMHLLGWPQIFIGKHLEIVKTIYESF